MSSSKFGLIKLILKQKRVTIGLAILCFLLVYGLASFFYPINPTAPMFGVLDPPSSRNPFGTDAIGRDVFAQTLHGTWYSLKIGFFAGVLTTIIGIVVGGIGGYFGKIIDEALSTLTNVVMTIPTLALLIVISSYIPIHNEWIMILLIASVSWPWCARAIRAAVLSLKTREFVDIARQLALGRVRIIFIEILPNILAYVVMSLALSIGVAIISEASLSALGLGPTDVISLGIILRWAITFNAAGIGAWWWLLPPGILICLCSTSLLLIKDGLDQFFNPRARR
ncbi:MAG: ABC transporter permease [Candidatus Bathyarchaeia archaeon]